MENYKEIFRKYKFWLSSPIFGLIISFVLFYIQDLSILLSSIIIFCSLLVPIIIILVKERKKRINQLKDIRNFECNMIWVIRILNKKGDASIRTNIKIINSENSQIEFLDKEIFSTPGKSIKLFKPRILKSSINNISLDERVKNYFNKHIKIDQENLVHKYVECDYRIYPPLRKKGDFIKYELIAKAREHCKLDDVNNSNIEGFIVKNIASFLKMTIISPKNSKIELLDYWVEDLQSIRMDYMKSVIEPPRICANGELLKWFLVFPKMNCLYLFKYRIVKS